MAFKWWDLAVQNKKPFALPSLAPVHAHVAASGVPGVPGPSNGNGK